MVKLGDTVTLRVVDPVAEHGSLALGLGCLDGIFQYAREARAVEYVVAKHQTRRVVADKLASDDKCLCKPVGRRLDGVGEVDPVVRPVAEQLAEHREVSRRGDNQDVAYPCKHQRRDGVIHHRLVKHGSICLLTPLVIGYNRVPDPPASTIPFIKMY